MEALGIPYESWGPEQVNGAAAGLRPGPLRSRRSCPPTPPSARPRARSRGAVFFPCAGYISDPQLATHNVQRAAEAGRGEFRFNSEVAEILTGLAGPYGGRSRGVKLASGEEIQAPVVVNVAGPHSYKINEHGRGRPGT